MPAAGSGLSSLAGRLGSILILIGPGLEDDSDSAS